MANTLLIEKETGGYFGFTLTINGNAQPKVRNMRNDAFAIGDICHFKTAGGANIIKTQNIAVTDITLVASGTFTFTDVDVFLNKLIEVGFYDWLNGSGGSGVSRFDQLDDTFEYFGQNGKVVVVNETELKLEAVTFYNYNKFTQLQDVPSSIAPNKMLVGNTTGTALEFIDQPTVIPPSLTSVGSFHYSDSTTTVTPIVVLPSTPIKLTNDGDGDFTVLTNNPYGVSGLWDVALSQFDFTQLSIGDQLTFRANLIVTTTVANQRYTLGIKFGIGSTSEFLLPFSRGQIKNAGTNEIAFLTKFDMAFLDILNSPAEVIFESDDDATVVVIGWYIEVIRKNINVVNVTEFTKLSQFENDVPFAEVTDMESADNALDARIDVLENIQNIKTGFTGQAFAVWSGVGLTYNVLYPDYYIDSELYSGSNTTITLDTADPTNPRRDIIAVDATGVIKITGTPATTPVLPTIDTTTTLYITDALILAGATEPDNNTFGAIYKDNAEWTTSKSGGTTDFDNTTDEFDGTKCIDIPNAQNNYLLYFDKGSTDSVSNYTELAFRIKLQGIWQSNWSYDFEFFESTTSVSSIAKLKHGSYGFDRTKVGIWQYCVIPIADFNFTQADFDRLRIKIVATNGAFVDNIILTSSGGGVSASQKAITTIITDDGVANATTKDDVFQFKGFGGLIVSAIGKVLSFTQAPVNDHFKGVYTTLAALNAAHPTANEGDYAQVNEVGATDVVNYSWDAEESIWVQGGSGGSGATNTDMLPEGSSNLYFTTARVLATLLTGISFATGGSIVSTDSVLVAFGKLQKQISDNLTAIGLKQDTLVSGTNIKTIGGVSLLGSGDVLMQISITTSVSITTATTDGSGITQYGKHVLIKNGVNNINITVNGVSTMPTTYQKEGTGTITFVQGAGRTLRQVDATAILNGSVGSTATISSDGTTDSLRISNA